jgi:N-acetyl-beta-hexosaminidase
MSDDTSLEGMSATQRDELAQLAVELSNDPKTRPVFLRLTKHKRPGTSIPELELEDRLAAAVNPLREQITKLTGQNETMAAERNVQGARAAAQRDLKLSNDELEAVENFMVSQHKEGNAFTYEAAHEFLNLQRQTAQPSAPSYKFSAPVLPDKEEMKKSGGFRQHFRNLAHTVVDDLRAGRVKLS